MYQCFSARHTRRVMAVLSLILTARCSSPIGISYISFDGLSKDTEAGSSCFLEADAGAHSLTERAMQSVVMLRVIRSDGRPLLQGTGFVVADSDNGETLKILTAGHVVGHVSLAPDAYRIGVWLSDGSRIGDAEVAAIATPWDPATQNDLSRPDIAVLRISAFQDARAETRYRHLQGLPLGPQVMPNQMLQAQFTEPARSYFGLSGAPVVDAQGLVRGIMTKSERPDLAPFGSKISLGWAEPIRSGTVLQQLGAASSATAAPHGETGLRVSVAGFPLGNCASLHADATPANRPMQSDLSQQFQSASR